MIGGPGSISAVDMSATGGCTFVGLGRLLTRSNKTFLELIDLAKQGDQRKVDICGNDLKPDVDQGDVYTAIATDLSVCHFGKALTNPESEFKDADLLASLLKTICTDLIRATRLNAQVNQIEKVYIAGNFVNNDHNAPDIRFLRHGGYMGAIGAMMVDAKKTLNQ
ncbi:hypothetical protein NP493_870g00003 [Ridgeia piscesae]|uniref:Uncharacterized protein n=1 Tax=Ridgeia piscesae TaxID=27915 RepID=A0AAD9KLS2_RIDPI|nr:hypothetical protein NP493_870g00003 [Ridgeia piscesae]